MIQPFIRNHQFNELKKQIGHLQKACTTVSDPKVVQAVRNDTEAKIGSLFEAATSEQKQAFEGLDRLQSVSDFQRYLKALEPFALEEYAEIAEAKIKKLFPKVKKLKVPDLQDGAYRRATYIGWTDTAANKLFLVYGRNGTLVGIEGRYTPTNKKGVCFFCNRHAEVALFTAVAKWKPAGVSPDYYRALGNYLCVDSRVCNANITDVDVLERYLHDVLVGPDKKR